MIRERFVVLINTNVGVLKVVVRREDGAPLPYADAFSQPDLPSPGAGGFSGQGGGFSGQGGF